MKEERERETRSWLDDSSEHARRILELEQALETSRKSLQEQQSAHQKECKLFDQVSQRLLADIKSKEKAMEILGQQHRDETLAQAQKHETLVHALKVRMAQKVADVDRLHARVSELHADKVKKATLMKQIEAYETQIETLIKENSDLAAKTLAQQQQTEQLAQADHAELPKQEAEELSRLSEALKTAEQDNLALQTRVTEVESVLAEQVSLLQRQKQSHARAMERLVESSAVVRSGAHGERAIEHERGSIDQKQQHLVNREDKSYRQRPRGIGVCHADPIHSRIASNA